MSHRIQTETSISNIMNYKMNQKPFIMFFFTQECGVCHAILPRLKNLIEDYEIELIEIDALKYPAISGQHQVFTVPTMLVWSEGREVLRESRFFNFEKVKRTLEFMEIYQESNTKRC